METGILSLTITTTLSLGRSHLTKEIGHAVQKETTNFNPGTLVFYFNFIMLILISYFVMHVN